MRMHPILPRPNMQTGEREQERARQHVRLARAAIARAAWLATDGQGWASCVTSMLVCYVPQVHGLRPCPPCQPSFWHALLQYPSSLFVHIGRCVVDVVVEVEVRNVRVHAGVEENRRKSEACSNESIGVVIS